MINPMLYLVLVFLASILVVGIITIVRNAAKITHTFEVLNKELESEKQILKSSINLGFQKRLIGTLSKKISTTPRISKLTISRSAHKWEPELLES